MLSYMLPTEDKPPPGTAARNYRITRHQVRSDAPVQENSSSPKIAETNRVMIAAISTKFGDGSCDRIHEDAPQNQDARQNGGPVAAGSPKHNGTAQRKSTLQASRVVKDDSLHSIGSDASTVGSEKKSKIFNGPKHASLKRVSFGSSKGSMVETLVYETPVQEEPENNHFLDQNGRLPASVTPVPDTDEGRERVRVSLLEPAPSPATPGVLLLEASIPTGHLIDAMATSPAELLTAHTEHTTPALYHTQISTDSGWDNPFRPDGDLSKEADEIVELIKGGKPITPTPGQTAPPLPGCDASNATPTTELNSSASAHPKTGSNAADRTDSRLTNQGNGNARGTPNKAVNATANSQQQLVNEKVGAATNAAATVEVGRVTAQGPGDASQVEHVTLKKKPKCKCCVLQ